MRSSFLLARVFRWVPVCVVALCVIVVKGSNFFASMAKREVYVECRKNFLGVGVLSFCLRLWRCSCFCGFFGLCFRCFSVRLYVG